ncbi:DNA polymerase III subunit beta [Paenibacillus sp. 1781tsa1]|uniref:DNA polymerase III subunit beta n=1 Tax=Paenibacillus sp. 1781tsa1 TaxID=2953810 RepID=UPI00209F5BE8|nr:DNA polymerase III subunit beta [Paenibacillus sp. 1781tsa1]MCP1184375.1 DNA polymerase III subunit beta [Paenibacillus sp. 1781tsa1]
MLVEITKDSLMNAIQYVIKAVAANSSIPILQGIHIQAGADGVTFRASNTSMTIQSMIAQDGVSLTVKRTGAIVIPSRYFHEIIRKFNDDKVRLEIKEPMILLIVSGHSQLRLCGMDPSEFPSMDHGEAFPLIKMRIHTALFRSTIKQLAIVASTSDTSPILTGVSLEFRNDCLNLIATDGVRLAYRALNLEDAANNSVNVIIPAKNLYELSKMLNKADETTEIEVINNRVNFTTNGLKVESALIEGTFPSMMNVIPQSYMCEISVDKACLLKAVECVTVMASAHVIKLVANADTLKLLSKTADVGEIQNEIPILEMRGEEFMISLNGKFFFDILRNMDCASVRIRFAGKTSPIVVLPDNTLMSSLFLITPVMTR